MRRGERVYSAADIVPNPSFGEARKYGNHLRLIEHAMAGGLPARVAEASSLCRADRLVPVDPPAACPGRAGGSYGRTPGPETFACWRSKVCAPFFT